MENEIKSAKQTPTLLYDKNHLLEILDPPLKMETSVKKTYFTIIMTCCIYMISSRIFNITS